MGAQPALQPDFDAAPERIRSFLERLSTACAALLEPEHPAGAELPHSLLLATAALRYAGLTADENARPYHVAVLGPTQTGKSTLVNLLVGCRAAEVSPLAGFTVHAQGFWIAPAAQSTEWVNELFPGWTRRPASELRRDELAAWSLTRIAPGPVGDRPHEVPAAPPRLPPCVVWDTPDFDSLAARQYARGVLEVAALADLYVLVLSKEKYSDLSVWRLLELLEPLGRKLVICVNKLTPEAQEPIVHSVRQRLDERGPGWGPVAIIPLLYHPQLAAGELPGGEPLGPLLLPIEDGHGPCRTAAAPAPHRAAGVRKLLERHWSGWTAPVRAELAARAEWRRLVREAGERFLAAYSRDYLEHPERFDSFRRAAVELLNLLELPHIGGWIARARRLVTWPVRQAIQAGRSWLSDRRPVHTLHSLGAEAGVLVDEVEALLNALEKEVVQCAVREQGRAVWRALAARLEAERPRLRGVFESAIVTHHEQSTAEIRAAAGRLYVELQKHPARLAALRTGRAAMDAGYLLLAVKTGGLTPLDAIWAPATFAFTTLVMEGIAELELGHEARALKRRQKERLETEFVAGTLRRELDALADGLRGPGLLGIEADELAAADDALAAWEAVA